MTNPSPQPAIHQLPSDVLSLIICSWLGLANSDNAVVSTTTPNHPCVVASHVCASWRSLVVHETPLLWSKICVRFPKIKDFSGAPNAADKCAAWCNRLDTLLDTAETWIHRSQGTHVDLFLDTGYIHHHMQSKYRTPLDTRYTKIVQALSKCRPRWKSVQCNLYFGFLIEDIVSLFDHDRSAFPLLESAAFNFYTKEATFNTSTDLSVQRLTESGLFGAPLLRTVNLRGFWGVIPSPSQAAIGSKAFFISESVTNLVYEAGSMYPQTLELLRAMPNLSTLQICCFEEANKLKPPKDPICLPNLRSLTLSDSMQVAGQFGQSLDLPQLEKLHLDFPELSRPIREGGINKADDGYGKFILQFGKQLKELTFYHESLTPEDLCRCIEELSSVKVLKLRGTELVQRFGPRNPDMFVLSQLAIPGRLTRLEVVELQNIGGSAEGKVLVEVGDAILGFLCARLEPELDRTWVPGTGRALRKAHFHFLSVDVPNIRGDLERRGVELGDFDISVDRKWSPSCWDRFLTF